jgi:chemotaxis protein MotA
MRRIDFAVPAGLIIGLAAIGGSAMIEGIRLGFLWQPTAALIVLGGTIGAIVVRRSLGGLWCAARAAFGLCLKENKDELSATLARLVWLARTAQRDGVRVLDSYAESSRDPLIARGLALAADYAAPAAVRAALDRILDREDEAALREITTLEAAGGYAPTFGILGAVLGLIQVLRSLADPGALGTGIATAFVATIYGIGLANLVLFPLASRLRERHEARLEQRQALAEALVALAAHESPSAIAHRFTPHPSPNEAGLQAAPRKVAG